MRLSVPVLALALTAGRAAAETQVPGDRTDPGVATRESAQQAQREPAVTHAPSPVIAPGPASGGAGAIATPDGVVARTIEVEGRDDVPRAEMDAALASYTGHRLGRDDLRDLLAAVSGVARARGFIFASSSIPAQDAGSGVLRVVLDEGRIDEVRLTRATNRAVQAMLAPLVGHPPRRAELERRIALAGDLPGVTIGSVRYAREGDRGVLIVPVAYDRVAGHVAVDNWGVHELGPERLQLAADVNGVFGQGDVLTVGSLVTPLQPRELKVVTARYADKPVRSGTELAFYGSYGKTRSGGYWRSFDLTGESKSLGASATQPLIRGRRTSLWLSGEFDYVAVDQRASGDPFRRDRVASAGLSLNGFVPLAGGRLRARIGATQGLDVLGATEAGDPLASRPEAGGRFTIVSAWANWAGNLGGPFSASVSATGQLASAPLLAFEQIDIGGPLFGRGYDYAERAGDEGLLGSAEVQARLRNRSNGVLRYIQAYVFADAGDVGNLRNSYGTGDLYSAGLGTRMLVAKTTWVELEAAFPIGADRFQSGDRSPRVSATVTSSL